MIRKTLAALLSLALLSACSHKSPETPGTPSSSTPYKLPDELANIRFVWTAEPGVDLTSGPTVAIRAYQESFVLQHYARYPVTYPGYADFLRAHPRDLSVDAAMAQPDAGLGPEHSPISVDSYSGPVYYHLLKVQQEADKTWLGLYCYGYYSVFGRYPHGQYRVFDPEVYPWGDQKLQHVKVGLTLVRLEQKTGAKESAPTPPAEKALPSQSGPLAAPAGDVFGDWGLIIAALPAQGGFLQTPEWEQQLNTCYDKMPDSPEKRVQILKSVLDAPPPLPAPVPGWAAAREG